jgi:hypothetical protein
MATGVWLEERTPEDLHKVPKPGQLVIVRQRHWLVEGVNDPSAPGQSPLVHLSCADDDNQGQPLSVLWHYELDRRVLDEEAWSSLGKKGFDPPRAFAAFINTMRWHNVTATDPDLFQSPFRAGITIDAYQMEPLRMALRLPRVNLFIADDTGLGKTIEAGLIARELLLRKKVRTIVVAAPASVLEQWQGELDERFGLTFEILNRDYLTRVRRDRGFGINPWRTHSRFLVSHNLLIDESYADPLREWLGDMQEGSLLVLDEAHHAAPARGNRYGIETKFTRNVRDLARRFEHRLFLSATPHNGHSASFATLLEILDPFRFTRGVKVREGAVKQVMVRRIKEDLRTIQGGFPKRVVNPVLIRDLPPDAPELVLSRLLEEYRVLLDTRLRDADRREQTTGGLMAVGLQQRLLSSIEAFARGLARHRDTMRRARTVGALPGTRRRGRPLDIDLLVNAPSGDDERTGIDAGSVEGEEMAQVDAATEALAAGLRGAAAPPTAWDAIEAKLAEMADVADRHRRGPDAKARHLVGWIRDNLCPGLPPFGTMPAGPRAKWNDRRVIIFTEHREGTRTWLKRILAEAVAGTDRADERIEVIDGLVAGDRRRAIQRRFNASPADEPLRILLCTDAAREGLNLQAHCTDLFHFDLPWNPGRIEQRNGRIDRKLQPAAEVTCHYFILAQRKEDHVLDILVRKADRIRRELGSMSDVLTAPVEKLLAGGIRHAAIDALAQAIDRTDLDPEERAAIATDIDVATIAEVTNAEAVRRQDELRRQIRECQELLQRSRDWVRFEPEPFRAALDQALGLVGADPLVRLAAAGGVERWAFPSLSRKGLSDGTWYATLDTLRRRRPQGVGLQDWRDTEPVRPVTFADPGFLADDTVQLHLDQRVVQRLLGQFRAQGLVQNDLSRACLFQGDDTIERVALIGRLSIFGRGAERLHEELVVVAAPYVHPNIRDGALKPYASDQDAHRRAAAALMRSLDAAAAAGAEPPRTLRDQLEASAARDVQELRPHLDARGHELAAVAIRRLEERGLDEAAALERTLIAQRDHVKRELERVEATLRQGVMGITAEIREEREQQDADRRHMAARLATFDRDIQDGPRRFLEFYEVQASRVEPVGLAYLFPRR